MFQTLFLIIMIFLLSPFPAFSLSNHQILRRIEGLSRAEVQQIEKIERFKKTQLTEALKKKEKGGLTPGFYIHEPIACRANNYLVSDEMEEKTKKSFIDSSLLSKSSLHKILLIEVIKAHLQTARDLYLQGKRLEVQSVIHHSINELAFYEQDIANYPLEDLVRPTYYIFYVIYPVFKDLLDKIRQGEADKGDYFVSVDNKKFKQASCLIEYPNTEKTILFEDLNKNIQEKPHEKFRCLLSFLLENENRNIYKTEFLLAHQKTFSFLDKMQNKLIKTQNIYKNHSSAMIKILIKLWMFTFESYDNMMYCPHYSMKFDPFVDPYSEELPDFHDTYILGYGFMKRSEYLTKKLIYDYEEGISHKEHLFHKTDSANEEENQRDRVALKKLFINLQTIFHNVTMKKDIYYPVFQLKKEIKNVIKIIKKREKRLD